MAWLPMRAPTQRAVVVRVHETGSQYPPPPLDDPIRAPRAARRNVAEMHDAVAVDQHVALERLGPPVTVHDHDIGDELADRHKGTVPANPLWRGFATVRVAGSARQHCVQRNLAAARRLADDAGRGDSRLDVCERWCSGSRRLVCAWTAKWSAEIGPGLCCLVGATHGDDRDSAVKLAAKVWHLRILADENGHMNRSVAEVGGEFLVVSQFHPVRRHSQGSPTVIRRGRRPRPGGPADRRTGHRTAATGCNRGDRLLRLQHGGGAHQRRSRDPDDRGLTGR